MTGPDPTAPVWQLSHWQEVQSAASEALLRQARPPFRQAVVPFARRVMRTFTSSFFIVTRFLPARKRHDVEVLYANVRYPDEVVDVLPLPTEERCRLLDEWSAAYERGLQHPDPRDAVQAGVPATLAAFCEMVRDYGIPPEHYRAFLRAMRRDLHPAPYPTYQALIEDYVYGSAIVVGFFLTHIFGASAPDKTAAALECAREFGIGLQMTNFLRDVPEDLRRGRVYLPLDRLTSVGLHPDTLDRAESRPVLDRLIRDLAIANDAYYATAARGLPLFSADTRTAIEACIRVYRTLNSQIAEGVSVFERRASVPFILKFQALPLSKYWVLPYSWVVDR